MINDFNTLISTFQPTVFTRWFFCNFNKIKSNSFKIKVQLNILNSLLWESDIDKKFIEIITQYPETREVLPILLAVREKFKLVLNIKTKQTEDVLYLFNKWITINNENTEKLLEFFTQSWLKEIFQTKIISDLNDYVFGIETWLDSNARKNRSWKIMEELVEEEIKQFCDKKWYIYKPQVKVKQILDHWWVEVKSDKSDRIFDFVIYDWQQVFLIETNFYGSKGSKLKAVAGEFSNLYAFLSKQNIPLIWITDWAWRQYSIKPLEEAYNATEWNIYNLHSLKNWILANIIKQL